MEFMAVIKKRRSIRAFLSKPIEERQLQQILEAANLAPSAHNLQHYKIYIVKDEQIKQQLVEAARGQNYLAQAPVVLVFVATPEKEYPRSDFYSLQDATIACYQSWLTAVSLGLSCVWIGAFEDKAVKKVLELDEKNQVAAILPIGYPAEKPRPFSRKNLKEITVEI